MLRTPNVVRLLVQNGSGNQPVHVSAHLEELRRSGLNDNTIRAAGIYSETDRNKIATILNRRRVDADMVPGIVFPFLRANGESNYSRIKPDHPRQLKGKSVKYESPRDQPNELYIPPGTFAAFDDPTVPILITEGEKKALAASQAGFACVGLVGAYGFKVVKRHELHPTLAQIKISGRDVYIVFDSDIATNPDVMRAEVSLAQLLIQRGANVKLVRLPAGNLAENGKPTKIGLDDYLVSHSVEGLHELLKQALDPSDLPAALTKMPAAEADFAIEVVEYLNWQCQDGVSRLRYLQGEWLQWRAGRYKSLSTKQVEANVVTFLNKRRSKLETRHLSNAMMQLRSQAVLPAEIESPSWLDGQDNDWPAEEVIACKNQIIHVPSLVTNQPYSRPATPRFFTVAALDFDFNVNAQRPVRWLEFLEQLWPNRPDCISTLQEWFGYCLTPDTRQQKILCLIGPKRSGKGTIARILQQLVGQQNTAGPTLAGLATNFGLAPLLDKSLAVVSDARLSGRSDNAVLVERLLSISGEDTLTIDRKFQDGVTTKLPTRLMLLSNELPRLLDASNALASRLIILPMQRSFYCQEDPHLTDRLLDELPGILLWAIEGWRRLHERCKFVEPAIAVQLRDDLERMSSPVGAFVRERCVVSPEANVTTVDIYKDYQQWCLRAGGHVASQPVFARDLRAVVTDIDTQHPRTSSGRERRYVGIGLIPAEAPT
jgi:putative DNA primase/helicase